MTVPVEFGKGELFGNGAGAAKALATTDWTSGDKGAVFLRHETELVITVTNSVLATTKLELRVLWSPDEGVTYIPLTTPKKSNGVVIHEPMIHQLDTSSGSIGSHYGVIPVPTVGYVDVQVRRTGGGAGSAVYVSGYAREPGYFNKSALVGESSGPTVVSSDVDAWSNAGAAKALTAAFVAHGTWFSSLNANDMLLSLVLSNSGGGPTSCDVILEWSPDNGVTAYRLPAINLIAGGLVSQDDEEYTTPSSTTYNHSIRCPIDPGISYRVSAKRTGGATLSLLAKAYLFRV
jgi:hypothetical protein